MNTTINATPTDIEYGENEIIDVAVNENATGYIAVRIGERIFSAPIVDGKAKFNITGLNVGNYTNVNVAFYDDSKYANRTYLVNFTVFRVDSTITVKINDTTYPNKAVAEIMISDYANGTINITVGNETKTVLANGGENTIVISNMTKGNQTVTVTYSGDDKYNSTTVIRNVTVRISINVVEKLTRGINSPYDYEVEFLNKDGTVLQNTDVQFVVNGKTYTVKTDDKGIARLSASKLGLGTYNVTSINPVTGQKVTKQLSIVKRLVDNKDITMDFSSGKAYTVKVIGDDGKVVGEGEFIHLYVNSIHYVGKTDKNGIVKLVINLNPGKYKITAEYKHYKVANNIKVKQILTLVKKTVKVKKGKKLKLKATLKWANGKAIKGKKITFKFKGKKYMAKTNKKGIAKVTLKKKVIKKLKKGKKYRYSAKYLTNMVKGKVKVKK
ncbi:MAG: Ig-like domain repeat protein [Methanosphaera sp.]|nr:Ig-like domain repeat protein [Methanosphaera sp.]